MAIGETVRLLAALELDNRKFLRGVSGSLAAAGKLDKGLSRAGRGVGRLGGGLGKAGLIVGGAVVAGLGASAKAAIDFQDAFQGVVKTVDEADLASAGLTFDDLSDSIRAMAREMPISATALAGIAEQAGALGIKAGDIESFTRQVAILSTTTDVSADDAATALGQLQNVIGLTGAEFDNFAAALVDLGNKGASTESQILEIARRSGGAAKLFGIAKDEMLGWSSAAANLGLNQELAGTALQNVFIKLLPKFQRGTKDLQRITGKTGQALKTAFKKDAGKALQDLIKDLGKMNKEQRLAAVQGLFGKGSGITRLVLGLADSFDKNLNPSIDESTKAWKEATAAQLEFEKRNQTVRSAFTRLKNNVIDAAISIGEGMVPALGRAADRLATFLKDPANRTALQNIGRDIGEALDKINWDKLLNAAKSVGAAFKPALDIILKIAEKIAELPPGVIGGAGALIITDRVTGGAISGGIGGIIGGLGESLAKSLAAKIPLFGSAFVQPVFVTNLGVGGLGGGVPGVGGGGTGIIGKGLQVLGGVTVVLGAAEIASMVDPAVKGIAFDIHKNLGLPNFKLPIPEEWPWGPKNTPTILPEIFGGNGLLGGTPKDEQPVDVRNPGEIMAANIQAIETAKAAQVQAIRDTGSTTGINIRGTTGAVQTAQGAITSAIYANRPIVTTNVDVNVTSSGVERSTTTSTRYGEQNGSAGRGITNDRGKG